MSCFKNMPSHRIQVWYIYQRKALHLLSCSGGRWVFVLSLRPSTLQHPKNRHASLQTSFLPASTFPDTVNFLFLNLKTCYPSMTTGSAKAVHPETPCAALPRGGCCTSGASTTWRALLPSAVLGWTEKWGPKMMPKIMCYFWRFFFRWWTVKMSSRQFIPLITTSISWAGVKHLKLTRAKSELSCQLGVKGKIVPCHLKSSFDSNQTNLSETEQNNSINFIILSRTTDQWTIREADVSHKHYHMFLTSIGEG